MAADLEGLYEYAHRLHDVEEELCGPHVPSTPSASVASVLLHGTHDLPATLIAEMAVFPVEEGPKSPSRS
eukprot:6255425-Prorocentrum_lima.AAC.1